MKGDAFLQGEIIAKIIKLILKIFKNILIKNVNSNQT